MHKSKNLKKMNITFQQALTCSIAAMKCDNYQFYCLSRDQKKFLLQAIKKLRLPDENFSNKSTTNDICVLSNLASNAQSSGGLNQVARKIFNLFLSCFQSTWQREINLLKTHLLIERIEELKNAVIEEGKHLDETRKKALQKLKIDTKFLHLNDEKIREHCEKYSYKRKWEQILEWDRGICKREIIINALKDIKPPKNKVFITFQATANGSDIPFDPGGYFATSKDKLINKVCDETGAQNKDIEFIVLPRDKKAQRRWAKEDWQQRFIKQQNNKHFISEKNKTGLLKSNHLFVGSVSDYIRLDDLRDCQDDLNTWMLTPFLKKAFGVSQSRWNSLWDELRYLFRFLIPKTAS